MSGADEEGVTSIKVSFLTPHSHVLRFTYVNYRGETSRRRVKPTSIWFGSTQWHKEEQWLMRATDLEKDEVRDFAMRDMRDIREV